MKQNIELKINDETIAFSSLKFYANANDEDKKIELTINNEPYEIKPKDKFVLNAETVLIEGSFLLPFMNTYILCGGIKNEIRCGGIEVQIDSVGVNWYNVNVAFYTLIPESHNPLIVPED
jgi:hypothetical protein